MVPVFKNVRERFMAKNCLHVSLLSVIRKVFKIFVNKAGLKNCSFAVTDSEGADSKYFIGPLKAKTFFELKNIF